jgi:hypothetical protein
MLTTAVDTIDAQMSRPDLLPGCGEKVFGPALQPRQRFNPLRAWIPAP